MGKKLNPGELLTTQDEALLEYVRQGFGTRKSKNKKRVMVASLTLTMVPQEAYGSHCSNFYQLGRDCKGYDFAFVSPRRMSIDNMRNMCVQLAVEGGFDYLYFFDDDTVNDINVLGRLLPHMKEFNAVSASYFVRGYPFDLMAFRWKKFGDKKKGFRLFKGNEFKKFIDKDNVIRNLGALGNGCTLYRVEDFKQVSFPWFATGPNFTEDVYWFMRAHHTIEDYQVGMDMSIRCGHLCQPVYVDLHNVHVLRTFHKRLQTVGGLSQ